MPLVAFALAKMFSLDKVAAIAVLVTGSCPGGNLSNILAYFLYGDMTLRYLITDMFYDVRLNFLIPAYLCCNLSADVALNVRFTTNEMCAKNNTHIYVVRTSNNDHGM